MNNAARRKAFDTVMRSLDFDKLLPERVFIGEWTHFLFFESDRIFESGFMDAMCQLLRLEHAKVACLLNVDKTEVFELENVAALFLDEAVFGKEYGDELRAGGPADAWLYRVDRYACASDVGEWCIYCEKSNDIAVVGLRSADGIKKFEAPLQHLWARPIEDLMDGGCSPLFPFDHLVPAWREGLVSNYRNGG
ncbi:hypothetical protein P3T23_009574 [Paraburkholderia sp. GAS448]|uniref:hypothetical protein n=1 Tax=Paraburkholderia sp. GAS448 TaxID=3035136 RepID=UPI003D2234DF